MNILKELKKKIYKDDRIQEVLELLGCHHVKPEKDMFVAALPNGNNLRSVQIKNVPSLTSYIRSKGVATDVYGIVSYIEYNCHSEDEMQANLNEAKMWLVKKLNYWDLLDEDHEKVESPNGWLKDIRKKRHKIVDLDSLERNVILPESIKDQYLMLPHKEWLNDHIYASTQEEFEIGFDFNTNRIVFMIRNQYGELIGVKGRTLDEDYEQKKIPKYLYLYEMNKHIELFNFHRAKPFIEERRTVFVFESEKSPMLAWQFGYKESVGIQGDSISPEQAQILKNLGRDIEIILCYDKDKTEKFIKKQAKLITNRKVFYTFDKDGLLGTKASPVDLGRKIFKELIDNKILFTP